MDRNIHGCRTKRERVEIAAQLKKPMYIHVIHFNAISYKRYTYIKQYTRKNGCNVLLKVKWYFRTRHRIRYTLHRAAQLDSNLLIILIFAI